MKAPAHSNIHWHPTYRIIATRFPAVDLWEGLDPGLWARLDQVEAMTSPRFSRAGESSSYVQWPFDNPRPGRFSTDTFGAFYASRDERGAVAETVHYQAIRCREDRLDPHEFDMRVLSVEIEGRFHDLRGKRAEGFPGVMDPGSHRLSQILAQDLHRQGSAGILFSSVRDEARTPCVAAFTPAVIRRCAHLRYLTYRWDGAKVEPLYEKRPLD